MPFQFYKEDFKLNKNLKGSPYKLANINFPTGICVIPEKNLLLVTDLHSNELIKVYELNSLKYIKSFMQKGVGPNQQVTSFTLQFD